MPARTADGVAFRNRAEAGRRGRPELAGDRLDRVTAPTLLIVGGDVETVLDLDLDRRAAGGLRCEHRVEVISGASHPFEEPAALDAVARSAVACLQRHGRVQDTGAER